MTPNLHFYDLKPRTESLHQAVRHGFSQPQKSLPPKFFYDEAGSRLFDAICATPEYYQTRTELALLREHADEIAETLGMRCWLIEPGSGSSIKVRLLLEPLHPVAYQPLDISGDYLHRTAKNLAEDYPWLPIHAVCVDFNEGLSSVADLPAFEYTEGPRAVFFPGSSIGNFEPQGAEAFLGRLAAVIGANGSLLIGVDLKKDHDMLHAAYNDRAGVTAAFNLNLLRRINTELRGNFNLCEFAHEAFYNASKGRIEMHLRSLRPQMVRINGDTYAFAEGETIHTENSYKYDIEEFQALARRAGFTHSEVWTDAQHRFSLHAFKC